MSTTADWHKEACTEVSVNHDSTILENTDAAQAGAHVARAVLARLDRLWETGTVRCLSLSSDILGKQY